MLEFSKLTEIQIIVFGLILLRMSSFVFSAAILNSTTVSVSLKILLSLSFTMMMYGTISSAATISRISDLQDQLILLALYEVLMGLIIGFMTRLFFFSISMAGEMISVAMGLGNAQIFNPMMGANANAFEQFLMMISTLLFFSLGGHHIMLQGLIQSFELIPLGRMSMDTVQLRNVALLGQELMVVSIKIAAPVLISMLVVQVGVGLLSRAVPQINVLTTSMSITALLGVVILMVSLPLLVHQMNSILDLTNFNLFNLIKKI